MGSTRAFRPSGKSVWGLAPRRTLLRLGSTATAFLETVQAPPTAWLPVLQSELANWRKRDKEEKAAAARLRRETAMALKWIAERLAMGNWTNVSGLLRVGNHPRRRKPDKTVKSETPLCGRFVVNRKWNGKRTCKSMAQEEYHEDGPRWSWVRSHMGNPG